MHGKELKWLLPKVSRNLYERRGNFENITLLAMTEAELSYNELPKDLASIANISKIIPNTFEVKFDYNSGLKSQNLMLSFSFYRSHQNLGTLSRFFFASHLCSTHLY